MRGQSPDAIKHWTQSDKRSFHSDQRDFDALIHVNTLAGLGRSDRSRKWF